jgi:hypothetical protein
VLRKAAQASVRAKIAGSDSDSEGEQSSFGRVQSGVAAAYLGMREEAYGRLKVMAVKQSMTTSLITSHEPNGDIFNTDGNGGIPHIVNTMLLQSHVRTEKKESQVSKFNFEINLLPALPNEWPNGKVTGLCARGGFEVNCTWRNGGLTEVTILSKRGGSCRICYRNKMITLDTMAGQSYRLNGELKL